MHTESKRAFCHHSSSKLAQSIIKDHMVSHYKKVYSAKAAIDTSVPKSLTLSVKYKDQIKQEQLKNGGRPHSAHPVLQRSSCASCSSAQSRSSLQYDDKRYLNSRSSTMSSPRFSTSFHAKEIVYPPWKVGSQDTHPASKLKYKSPEGASHTTESACSFAALGHQNSYKCHQDPVKKTYNGDLLQKHSHVFTPAQPFTPKTVKSDKSSYLSKYRYYRAPQRKPQDRNNSRLKKEKTNLSSAQTKEDTSLEYDEPSQGFSGEQEWSDEEFSGPHFSAARQPSQTSKIKDCDLYNSLFRVPPEETTPESTKIPVMMSGSAYEEELACLKFISAVTSDILSRRCWSDRVLDMVLRRHFDMNLYHLEEDKMCHLLEKLRKDIQGIRSPSVSSTVFKSNGNDLLHAVLPPQQLSSPQHRKSKEDSDLLSYASLTKYSDSAEYGQPLLASTPFSSPDRCASSSKANQKKWEDISQQRGTSSPQLTEHVTGNAGLGDEDMQQEQSGTTVTNKEDKNLIHESTAITNDEGLPQDQAEAVYDGHCSELEDLGRSLSESLHVSSDLCENNMDASNDEEYKNTVSVSDDEF